MSTLLLAEHDHRALSGLTAKALTAAASTGDEIHILVAGRGVDAVAADAAQLSGVAKVLVADAALYEHQLAEPLAGLIVKLAEVYDAVYAPSTTTWRSVMPRVAALLDVMQLSDVTKVVDARSFERPIYAGNALQTVRTADAKTIVTVRTTAFAAASRGGSAAIKPLPAVDDPGLSKFIEERLADRGRPDLTSAKVILSGGRSLGSKAKFDELILPLADKLGAAVGASRAAVDAGYAPNEWQVGQTGKIVAPDLYIAAGISGAIQHLAGIKDAKVIVAINKDEEAPIFQVADYGLVGDLFEILPELLSKL